MILRRFAVVTVFALLALGSNAAGAQTDPLLTAIGQFSSPTVQGRAAGFYGALALVPNAALTGGPSMGNKIQALRTLYPADSTQLTAGLTRLLAVENTDATIGTLMSSPEDESSVDFYLDLVEAVADLNDPSTMPALLGAIPSGGVVTNRLASFGPLALDPVVNVLYDSDFQMRHAAAFTLVTMLQPPFNRSFTDGTSHSKLHAGLRVAIHRFGRSHAFAKAPFEKVLNSMPAFAAGDLNEDGVVNCADLAIVAGALGKRAGQPGFDVRADLEGEGHVDWDELRKEGRYVAKTLGHSAHDRDHDDDFDLDDVLKSCHINIKR